MLAKQKKEQNEMRANLMKQNQQPYKSPDQLIDKQTIQN